MQPKSTGSKANPSASLKSKAAAFRPAILTELYKGVEPGAKAKLSVTAMNGSRS